MESYLKIRQIKEEFSKTDYIINEIKKLKQKERILKSMIPEIPKYAQKYENVKIKEKSRTQVKRI